MLKHHNKINTNQQPSEASLTAKCIDNKKKKNSKNKLKRPHPT